MLLKKVWCQFSILFCLNIFLVRRDLYTFKTFDFVLVKWQRCGLVLVVVSVITLLNVWVW